MNLITQVVSWISPLCGVVVVVVLIYGFIKFRIAKKKKRQQLGYNALTSGNAVNHIKTKAKNLYDKGRIPLGLKLAYEDVNRDSCCAYVKFLNKLTKRYIKKSRYYKKRPNEDLYASNAIMSRIGQYARNHKKEFACQKLDTNKVFRGSDYESR